MNKKINAYMMAAMMAADRHVPHVSGNHGTDCLGWG